MTAIRSTPPQLPGIRTPPADGDWTVADFMKLENPPGFHYELIEGHLLMSPSPGFWHQSSISILSELMSAHARRQGLGVVIVAPFDVVLREDDETAVQPDIVFVSASRRSIITPTHIEGAPDLVVEALSPNREGIDRQRKFRKYFEAGVREYWIVDPQDKKIEVWVRRGESLVLLSNFIEGTQAVSEVLAGFVAAVDEVFSER